MKKRAMKKWIPQGDYCDGDCTKKNPYCKWRKYITTIKRNKDNCEFSKTCKEKCWSTPKNSCRNLVYKCEYLNFVDWRQESLLFDACKECGVYTQTKEEYLWDLSTGNCKINKRIKS